MCKPPCKFIQKKLLLITSVLTKLKKKWSRWIYHFVALIWITEFIIGCQALIVASSVAKWYFTRDKSSLKSPICLSIRNLIVYHMGSVALGDISCIFKTAFSYTNFITLASQFKNFINLIYYKIQMFLLSPRLPGLSYFFTHHFLI